MTVTRICRGSAGSATAVRWRSLCFPSRSTSPEGKHVVPTTPRAARPSRAAQPAGHISQPLICPGDVPLLPIAPPADTLAAKLMYTPAHFEETRPEVMHGLITAHPLGTLVTLTPAGLEANPIPFDLVAPTSSAPRGLLRAHVARANPVWRDASRDVEALVIFQGPQSYISPSWYTDTKPVTGKVVPTWNYCVVHARGALRVIDDRDWLRAQLDQLVRRHESSRAAPWQLADAPADFIEKQLAAIVGIEIGITRLAGKWKLSQNRNAADRAGVVAGLRGEARADAAVMADLMQRALAPAAPPAPRE